MHKQLARISHSFPQVSNSAQNWLEKTMITSNAETNALLKHSLTIFFKIEYEKGTWKDIFEEHNPLFSYSISQTKFWST